MAHQYLRPALVAVAGGRRGGVDDVGEQDGTEALARDRTRRVVTTDEFQNLGRDVVGPAADERGVVGAAELHKACIGYRRGEKLSGFDR